MPGKPATPKKWRTCTTCKGKGTVIKWTTDRKGKAIAIDKTCPTCNGTGETSAT